jgi:hypothetical protein
MPNSNTRSIQVGSEDNTLLATVYNTDGSIKADLAFDTTGISIFVQRIGEANGSALTLSAKATPQTAHADGAFLNLGGGDISVDCPDAPFATYKGRARIYGTFTGGTIIGEWFDVVGFDAAAVAVGANTTTPPTPNQIMAGLVTGSQPVGSLARFVRDIKQADVLFEGTIITATSNTATLNGDATTVCVGQAITIGEEGDIERQTRWVVAFDPATKVVTLDSPWCVVPPDGSDYQIKVLRRSLTQAAIDAILTIDEKIDDLTELDDGDLRFTAKALEQGPSGGGGGGDCGDATEAKQDAILAALTTADIRRVALPIQDGTLAIVQGDTYDDIAQPKARFATERDFTDGWTVVLTIRDKDDAVVYSVAGVVESDESIAIAIAAPTGLPMAGCPGVWEGKFDVEVSKGASVVTIERGPAYVYEDQTR